MTTSITILSIETSCDETAMSLCSIEKKELNNFSFKIHSEKIFSQFEIHTPYGGVVPELAAREHLRALPLLLESTLTEINTTKDSITHIAVTRGPGLKGSLLAGDGFAIGLAAAWKKPILSVHHIEGHMFSPFINSDSDLFTLKFPYLSLVVSGGHTELCIVKDIGKYELLSKTVDDAAGEAFDKAAQLLNLGMPGGPKISQLAEKGRLSKYVLPEVMKGQQSFSFSGLKTAISLLIKSNKNNVHEETFLSEISYTIQSAIVRSLVEKVKMAVSSTGIKTMLVSGGVSANQFLRDELTLLSGISCIFPSLKHTGDNATMIALAGGLRELSGKSLRKDLVAASWDMYSQ